ncbi:MAG: DUF2339 domain-containing protein [Methylophilus sp.]
MELLAILFGIAVLVGSLAGFFSLFTKGDKEARLKALESEIAKINSRLVDLESNLECSVNFAQKAETQASVDTTVVAKTTIAMPIEEELETVSGMSEAEITEATAALPEEVEVEPISYQPRVNVATEPNVIEKAFTFAKDWLFGGNTLVRSGIVILFIGISFLIKYVAEHSNVPIELRLTGIALFGVFLLVLGWRLRGKRAEYAWALQGGGVGVLYLTIFAAMKLYQLIPPGAAFVLLIAVAFLSASIAVLQSALPLAILGFAGGFLAPIFTSTGHGSHVGLFSYYLVLNLAIAFIAYHKSWRSLNVLGFAFTFIIGTLWGASSYSPEHFATTEPFLIIHFLLFTLIAVLYAHRQATKASDYVDATLVFGTPLVGFSLQYALLRNSHFGLAYSALALAIFYMALAWWVLTRKRDSLQFLGECFLALGVGFATLTLPLALDGRWTSAAWAVEGVGLLWVGLKQNRTLPTWTGLALQLLGAAAFANGWGLTGYSETTHQNMFLGVGFIALAGWACGALINRYRTNQFAWLTNILAIWGWLWWVSAGLIAIDDLLPSRLFVHAALAFVAISSVLLPLLAQRMQWPKLAGLSVLLLAVMVLATMYEMLETHPFADYGMWAWLIAFAAYVVLLMREQIIVGSLYRAPLLWIAALIGGMEWQYQLGHYVGGYGVWHDIGWAVIPMLLIAGVSYWQFSGKDELEPAALSKAHIWGWTACVPLMLFVIAWFMLMSLNSDGNAAPLLYLPLLNPLDIALAGALLLFLIWQRFISQHFQKLNEITPILAGVMAFTLLNGMLLRTLHHWVGTPFRWSSIFDYPVVQMSFTFMWAITAFILMLLAHKKARRILWIVGAALMGLVVAKIFLLDLAQHGTVERIASFIGAGLMLLVMGYFAPLPPASNEADDVEVKEAV